MNKIPKYFASRSFTGVQQTAFGVELVHWNPRRVGPNLPSFLRHFGIGHLVNNFGDMLGPEIVRGMLSQRTISTSSLPRRRLLSIGSVMHLAQPGDVVWGTGINGKELNASPPYEQLDIRAVRGPRTRDFLLAKGLQCPETFGDPGLLIGLLMTREAAKSSVPARRLCLVPNLNDIQAWGTVSQVTDPRLPWRQVVAEIAASDLVVASSLHAVIVAEAFGIPARAVATSEESPFKYADYYCGTGRPQFALAPSVNIALQMGPETPPIWDPEPLIASFPWDLWSVG